MTKDYSEERRRFAERMKDAPRILAEKKTWGYSIFGPLPPKPGDKAVSNRQVGEWHIERDYLACDSDDPVSTELIWECQADGIPFAIAGPFPSPSDLAEGCIKAHNKCLERMAAGEENSGEDAEEKKVKVVIVAEGDIDGTKELAPSAVRAFQDGVSMGSGLYGAGGCHAYTLEELQELIKEDNFMGYHTEFSKAEVERGIKMLSE